MSIHDDQKKVATGITDGTHKQEQGETLDLASAIEYADARWSGVDVPVEWLRHFVDGLGAQQRTWVGLTDEEIEDCYKQGGIGRAVQILKEKNTTP